MQVSAELIEKIYLLSFTTALSFREPVCAVHSSETRVYLILVILRVPDLSNTIKQGAGGRVGICRKVCDVTASLVNYYVLLFFYSFIGFSHWTAAMLGHRLLVLILSISIVEPLSNGT